MPYVFVLARSSGEDIGRVTTATERNLGFGLNATATAGFTVPLTSMTAQQLEPGLTRLKVYRQFTRDERDRVPGMPLRRLCFYGVLPDTGLTEDASAGTARAAFADPRYVLASRYTSPDANKTGVMESFSGKTMGQILWGLIQSQNARVGGDTWIRQGGDTTSRAYDVTFDRRPVTDCFNDAAGLIDGPDIDIDPVDGWAIDGSRVMGDLHVYEQQGNDLPDQVFRFGTGIRGNCTNMTRTRLGVVTRAEVIGTDRATGGNICDTYGDPAASLYGLMETYQAESDPADIGYLQFRTRGWVEAYKVPRQVVEIQNPLPNAPRFLVDYRIGDTLRATCRVGAMTFTGAPVRVHQMQIGIDQNGRETVNLTAAEI